MRGVLTGLDSSTDWVLLLSVHRDVRTEREDARGGTAKGACEWPRWRNLCFAEALVADPAPISVNAVNVC